MPDQIDSNRHIRYILIKIDQKGQKRRKRRKAKKGGVAH